MLAALDSLRIRRLAATAAPTTSAIGPFLSLDSDPLGGLGQRPVYECIAVDVCGQTVELDIERVVDTGAARE